MKVKSYSVKWKLNKPETINKIIEEFEKGDEDGINK